MKEGTDKNVSFFPALALMMIILGVLMMIILGVLLYKGSTKKQSWLLSGCLSGFIYFREFSYANITVTKCCDP